MKFARIFSAGAGCSSVFYLALMVLIVVLAPHSHSQSPARVSTSQPLPDVLGIHLGMSPRDACAVFQTSHPKEKVTIHSYSFPTIAQPVINGLSVTSPPVGAAMEIVSADATLPPARQQISCVQRYWRQQMNRTNLFSSLREKYGKESFALRGHTPVADDRDVQAMVWLRDEKPPVGLPVPPSDSTKFQNLMSCLSAYLNIATPPWDLRVGTGDLTAPNLAAFLQKQNLAPVPCNYVVIHADVTGDPSTGIIPFASVYAADIPLAVRTANAEAAFLSDVANKQQQQEIERSKQAKAKL